MATKRKHYENAWQNLCCSLLDDRISDAETRLHERPKCSADWRIPSDSRPHRHHRRQRKEPANPRGRNEPFSNRSTGPTVLMCQAYCLSYKRHAELRQLVVCFGPTPQCGRCDRSAESFSSYALHNSRMAELSNQFMWGKCKPIAQSTCPNSSLELVGRST
jgi:hypothetical protein